MNLHELALMRLHNFLVAISAADKISAPAATTGKSNATSNANATTELNVTTESTITTNATCEIKASGETNGNTMSSAYIVNALRQVRSSTPCNVISCCV